MMSSTHQVFISHSSSDTRVARQIANYICDCGAACFLDESNVQIGDDFEEKIREAANASDELLVLLTPWAIDRPYVWLEMGPFGDRASVLWVCFTDLPKTNCLRWNMFRCS